MYVSAGGGFLAEGGVSVAKVVREEGNIGGDMTVYPHVGVGPVVGASGAAGSSYSFVYPLADLGFVKRSWAQMSTDAFLW